LTGSFNKPDNDIRGDWLQSPWLESTKQVVNTLQPPNGTAPNIYGWRRKKTYEKLLQDKRILFPKGRWPAKKKYFVLNEKKKDNVHKLVVTMSFGHVIKAQTSNCSHLFYKNPFDNQSQRKR